MQHVEHVSDAIATGAPAPTRSKAMTSRRLLRVWVGEASPSF